MAIVTRRGGRRERYGTPPRFHARGLRVSVRPHLLFLVLMTAGVVLRVLVQVTYEPAILFYDSYSYLEYALDPNPESNRPLGYSVLFLRPLLFVGGLALIPLVQHLLGLGMAAAIYAVLIRYRVRPWLAALAAAPVLLDGYQLQIEQNVMADPVVQALVVAALVLLIWHRRPGWRTSAAAGLLIGLAATMRSVGVPVLAVASIYVLAVNREWRRRLVAVIALAVTGTAPLLVYSTWVYQQTGIFRPGTGNLSAQAPYVRTAPLADCGELAADGAPGYILDMCPSAPIGERPQDPGYYQFPWRDGPAWTADYPPGVDPSVARREFGLRVTLNQPFDVIGAVLHDFLRGFAWHRSTQPGEFELSKWWFQTEVRTYGGDHSPRYAVERYGGLPPSVDEGVAAFLRGYQSVIYTRGPVFAAGLVLPVLALAGLGSARRSESAPALLVAATATAMVLAAATFAFSWRYQLPSIPLYPLAAVLALAAFHPRRQDRDVRSGHSR